MGSHECFLVQEYAPFIHIIHARIAIHHDPKLVYYSECLGSKEVEREICIFETGFHSVSVADLNWNLN